VVPNTGERFGRFSERTPSSHINHEKRFNHHTTEHQSRETGTTTHTAIVEREPIE